MAESMKGLKRTHRCAELNVSNVGENVTVMGWVQKQRNKGGIIFVDMSTLLTMPVAFIYLSPFLQRTQRLPLSGELSAEQAD